jgi:hypothetical protein
MNNALERVRKEAAVASFEVIFRHVETEVLNKTSARTAGAPNEF